MSKINILDESVFNKIAAGEVVERPACVVKELLDNSIDAGASKITIKITDGGIKSIQITDNGHGIEPDDFSKVFMPHATSKIKTAEDLEKIGTLGFRGEALASIASVSKVTLTSKVENETFARQCVIEGGKLGEITEVGGNNGTTICVENLFFNVPARAKFLKKPKSEASEISNLIDRYILCNPTIAFSYVVDDKDMLQSPGTNLFDAIYSVYGEQTIKNIVPVEGADLVSGIGVKGYVGLPTFSKANRTYQTLSINGRYVNSILVSTCVLNAYDHMLMKGQFPFYVLNLEIPQENLDVNVHPNKMEVRFNNPNSIYGHVFNAVTTALLTSEHIVNPTEKVIKYDAVKSGVSFSENNESKSVDIFANLNKINVSSLKEFNKSNILTDDNLKQTNSNINLGSENAEKTVQSNLFGDNSLKETEEDKLKFDAENFKNSLQDLTSEKEDFKYTSKESKIDYDFISKVYSEASCQPNFEKNISAVAEKNNPLENFKYNNINDSVTNSKENNFEDINSNLNQSSKTANFFEESDVKFIGEIFSTYLIIEKQGVVYLIDEHAGHERLLFDKFVKQVDSQNIATQNLLLSFSLNVNRQEFEFLENNLDNLRKIGFEIAPFGGLSFAVTSIPSILADINLNNFFKEVLKDLNVMKNYKQSDLIVDKLMQHSCKCAVRAGKLLSAGEVNSLINQMKEEKTTLQCPHGRPVVVELTKKEVEKWFKRSL